MKIYKTAMNKVRISLTKEEWISIGKQKGWAKTAQHNSLNRTKKEKTISFVVSIKPEVVQEFGKVFYDSEYELGLSMDKDQARIVYDILQHKAQSQEGEMEITLSLEANWNDETYVPYGDTEVGLGDSGWEFDSASIQSISLFYVDKITQKQVEVKLSQEFINSAEEALSEVLDRSHEDIDFGPSPRSKYNEDNF